MTRREKPCMALDEVSVVMTMHAVSVQGKAAHAERQSPTKIYGQGWTTANLRYLESSHNSQMYMYM